MDRLAAEGTVFTRALAAAPWTVPSVASMLTGLPTTRHRAGSPMGSGATFRRTPLPGDLTTLAERFAAAGYRTRAVAANGFVSEMMGLHQGFEVFDNSFNRAMGSSFLRDLPWTRLLRSLIPQEKLGDYRASGVTDQALAWLAEDDEAPLFLWVHYLGPHVPLRADPNVLDLAALEAMLDEAQPVPGDDGSVLGEVFTATSHVRSGLLWLSPEDKKRFVERYDRTVGYVDEHIGRLFATLRERERPVVAALTADHGEELWDHGHFEHGHDYYREVTQIPLVFWAPGRVPAGHTVETVVGHVDISPTLLDLATLDVPAATAPDEGRSLVPLFETREAEEDGTPVEEPAPTLRYSGGNLYGLPAVLVEDARWRFILRANGREELYDIQQDPLERFNVASDHPEVAANFRELLEPRLALLEAEGDAEAELSPEQLKALQSLGYVQ
jgi:arylsulfatase A-like enzyme